MKKILTIVGARPQFIKAAVVSRILKKTDQAQEVLLHTGQHFDANMSNVFFDELGIPVPDYNLGVQESTHGVQTSRMLEGIEKVLLEEKPDMVLVYGDTNSTVAGALAAVKLHIPVAHVEAGLRSYNRKMPEEINRVLTDHISTILFAPTETAVKNLCLEGISRECIHRVGDVMYDAALHFGDKAVAESQVLNENSLNAGDYILATVHRAENTDVPQRLKAIFDGLNVISRDIPVVLPLHPRTRKALAATKWASQKSDRVHLIDPVGYLDMVMLEKKACLIVTDSGGVQKEAFFHQVPCVTLRDETEWVELVELGWNALVSPETADAVASGVRAGLIMKGRSSDCYGNGDAASKIVDLLTGDKEH